MAKKMNKKSLRALFLLFILIMVSCVFYPSYVLARRIIVPGYTVSDEEIAALYREHGDLRAFPPYEIKHRLSKLKSLLDRDDAGIKYPELLPYASEYLETHARTLDGIEGLRVSYRPGDGIEKVEPMILASNPATVRNNLDLLLGLDKDFDQVKYSDLLYRISTFKLRNNVNFLRAVGLNPLESPRILLNATRHLKNNYFISVLLNREVTLSNLGLTTEDFVKEIKAEIPKEQYSLFGQNQLPEYWKVVSGDIVEMLTAQEEFSEWWALHPTRDLYEIRLKIVNIFDKHHLDSLGLPAISIFALTTAVDINSNLGKALFEFIKIALSKPNRISPSIADELKITYGLDNQEWFFLFMLIGKESKH